ncbi:YciI family protein [Cellulomonas composti]|uniref:YCII-related domain-containing protein n=1 Tax=Cellulomonas composti TaxID=266130 RepID=A0A511JA30_9CELL|nr:YciI family protein [Cellulomonas composti]GEL94845.1 hypothetical protein CCO02nite_15030 [Cellulomonas composti]
MEHVMFVIDHDEAQAEPTGELLAQHVAWLESVEGVRVFGARLRLPSDATVVRRRGDEVLVTAGPFAETTEWIGGFDVLEVPTSDDAIVIAARHPGAADGCVEVRAAWPFEA